MASGVKVNTGRLNEYDSTKHELESKSITIINTPKYTPLLDKGTLWFKYGKCMDMVAEKMANAWTW